jgi:hypothetical protein
MEKYHNDVVNTLSKAQQTEVLEWMKTIKDSTERKRFILNSIDDLMKEISPTERKKLKSKYSALDYGRRLGIKIWMMDHHIGTSGDAKSVFSRLGLNITVWDQSISGHCHLTGSCAKNLKWSSPGGHSHLSPSHLIAFYEAYKNDPEMKEVDIMASFYLTQTVEMYMPFNKSIFQVSAVRYELGNLDPNHWRLLNANLVAVAKDPRNVIGGNNMWDAKYINYFTGIPSNYFQSFCDYTNVEFTFPPKRKELLIGPSRMHAPLFNELMEIAKKNKWPFPMNSLRHYYPSYKFTDLAQHPAIIVLPYQISLMSIFEYYRMSIPLIFPSKKFLLKLEIERNINILVELTWPRTFSGKKASGSPLPRNKCSKIPFDPNAENDMKAMDYWYNFADFYFLPHITYFDSWEEISEKFQAMDLKKISDSMKEYNKKVLKEIKDKWIHHFNLAFDGMESKRVIPQNYQQAMSVYDRNYEFC